MTTAESLKLDACKISELLQITPPFLMIDGIELIPGKSAESVKYLSSDEWFFRCHLPKEMAMPGTLLIEAMLQTLVLTLYTTEGHQGKISYIKDLKIKLLKKVVPNSNLVICADLLSFRRGVAKGVAKGKIDDNIVS